MRPSWARFLSSAQSWIASPGWRSAGFEDPACINNGNVGEDLVNEHLCCRKAKRIDLQFEIAFEGAPFPASHPFGQVARAGMMADDHQRDAVPCLGLKLFPDPARPELRVAVWIEQIRRGRRLSAFLARFPAVRSVLECLRHDLE